jgi:hypothetical protein
MIKVAMVRAESIKGQASAKRRTNKEHIGKLTRDRNKEIPVSTCQAATVHPRVGQGIRSY